MTPLAVLGLFAAIAQVLGTLVLAGAAAGPSITVAFTASAASIVVGVMAWIVRKVVSGEVVPLKIGDLVNKQQEVIDMLKADRDAFKQERSELAELVKGSTEAQFAMRDFLRQSQRSGLSPSVGP